MANSSPTVFPPAPDSLAVEGDYAYQTQVANLPQPSDVLWVREFGTPQSESLLSVSVDPTGVYTAGVTSGVLPGQTSFGGNDAFVRAYDFSGSELWTHQFGTSDHDIADGIAADTSGVYLVGDTFGSFPGQRNLGSTDAFVSKYDLAGNQAWNTQFGTARTDELNSVSVDASGVYVAGWTDGDLGQKNFGSSDAFVRKYDSYGRVLWTRQFGTSGDDKASGIFAYSGGVYVTGSTSGVFPSQVSSGGYDCFSRKYDSDGNDLWTRQLGSSSDESCNGVTADAKGVYLAGQTWGALPGQRNEGAGDAFVRRYDFGGNEVWTRQFGTPQNDMSLGVSVDSGGVNVAGTTGGTLPGQTSYGGDDAFIRKYDFTGNEVSAVQFGTPQNEHSHMVSSDASAMLIVGETLGTFPSQTNQGSFDVFVAEVARQEAPGVLWTHQLGSTERGYVADLALDVSADAYSVAVVGITQGTLPGKTKLGGDDAFVRTYRSDGNERWTDQFGTSADDSARGVSIGGDYVYVVGETAGTIAGRGTDAYVRKYDIFSGSVVWTRFFGTSADDKATRVSVYGSGIYVTGETAGAFPGYTNSGGLDVFVRKYDLYGNEVWTRQFGSSGADHSTGISVDASGVYVSGPTYGIMPGQTSSGGVDAFVRKYDLDGRELWTTQFGGSGDDWSYGVSSDSIGVYVTGITDGLTGQRRISMSYFDAYVRKYDREGRELWTREFGTRLFAGAKGVAADGKGVYVTGVAADALPGESQGQGGLYVYVRKYDSAGNEVWTRQGFSEVAEPRVAVSSSGVYLAGDLEYNQGDCNPSCDPDLDVFVSKLALEGFDYHLTLDHSSMVLTQGSSVSIDLAVELISGTTQTVSFSISDLPLGVTSSFSPNSCNPPCPSTLELIADATAERGTFTVSVTAVPHGLTMADEETTVTLTVAPSTHATGTVMSCASPGIVGTPLSCAVSVTDTSESPTIPSGNVTFSSTGAGGSFSPTACALARGSCSVAFTPTAAGTTTVTGSYSGDTTHAASSGTATVTVKRATTTDVSCSQASVPVNAPTTCTATVTDASPETFITPTGSVSFTSSVPTGTFTPAASCTLSGSTASATCSVIYTQTASTTTPTITASYAGDTNHNAASATTTVTVTPRTTDTTVSCSPPTVAINQESTCTATIADDSAGSAITPTGTVSFTSSGTGTFSPAATCTLASGSCSATYTPTAIGTSSHSISASYEGDLSHSASGPTSTTVTVTKRTVALSVACSPASVVINQGTTCTATVTDNDPGGSPMTPSSSVRFAGEGDFSPSNCTLSGSGASASCSVSYTPRAVGTGTNTINATFDGDANQSAAAGSFDLTVQPPPFNWALLGVVIGVLVVAGVIGTYMYRRNIRAGRVKQ